MAEAACAPTLRYYYASTQHGGPGGTATIAYAPTRNVYPAGTVVHHNDSFRALFIALEDWVVRGTAHHRHNQSAAVRLQTDAIRRAPASVTSHMRITIESLNYETVRQFGFTPMAGYRVIFTAGPLRAGAWFVPATEDVSILVGQSFEVEVNQERVSDLVLVPPSESASNTFSAMPEFACFQVRGQVASAHPRNKDGGDPIAFVNAGDAYITLGDDELAGLELQAGDAVAFLMHDVSLWDSAI